MRELHPIVKKHLKDISYNYALRTSELGDLSRTDIESFGFTFKYTMNTRSREILKRKIMQHFEAKPKTQSKFHHRIHKIEITKFTLHLYFYRGFGELDAMPKILKDTTPSLPF